MKNKPILPVLLTGIFFSVFSFFAQSQTTRIFSSPEEAWQAVKANNTRFTDATLQADIAELAYKTSLGNVINPRMPLTATMIDNTRLQQNFIPAEAFGGPAGTFREVTLGQQYNSLLTIQPQFDIINLSSIAQIKAARINRDLTRSQNEINEFALYQNVNATFHNILSLQRQKEVLAENLKAAEQIAAIVKNRYNEGISRPQEVNEAEVNVITIRDKAEQLDYNLRMQYQLFALFFDNKIVPEIKENNYADNPIQPVSAIVSDLTGRTSRLQSDFLQQDIRSLQNQYYPVLAFTSSFNWQSLSNDGFFADNAADIRFNFVGLRLTWDLPTVQRLSTIKNKQYQLRTLENQYTRAKHEADTQWQQLNLEFEKAARQQKNMEAIANLKTDTYQKNLLQFEENILPLDKLLISYNDMILARLNETAARTQVGYQYYRILIHNQYP